MMHKAHRLGSVALAAVITVSAMLSLSGCQKKENPAVSGKDSGKKIIAMKDIKADHDDEKKEIGYQLKKPKKGEEIAVIETNMGNMKLRLFPHAAPKTVYNFKKLAESGYYNNVTFHRVIKDFMIQGGDPQGTGAGGESIWKTEFPDEFNKNLLNIRGSVSMANRGPNTNGSQFFINQGDKKAFPGWQVFQQHYDLYKTNPDLYSQQYGSCINMKELPDGVKKIYEEQGGNPTLDGAYSTIKRGHTVFGQVFEGLDVLDKIANVKTGAQDKPLENVIIKKIRITKYE